MRIQSRWLCLAPLLITIAIVGCGAGAPPNPTDPPGAKPVTGSLTASPASVQMGSKATLTWQTANATTVTIDQGIGTVAAAGTKDVTPTATTIYTLKVSNGSSSITSAATVTVTGAPPPPPPPPPVPPTAQISVAPTTVPSGQSATLAWSTANATAVSIDQGIGTVAVTGTKTVSPAQTTTYTLTATGSGQTVTGAATLTVTPVLTGVLDWKGGTKGLGNYSQETTLTTANVNPNQFGKVRDLVTDGQLLPQVLYVRSVDLGVGGVHDLLLVTNEHDSVYAYDGQGTSTTPLWHRNFVDSANAGNSNCPGAVDCVTTQADNHGGRSNFGGEIGITGTPVVDPQTGILYVVAATQQNGVVTDTLHALDIRTGSDVNGGSAVISATYPGTGEGQVNGQIPFAPAQQNQRPGLTISNGVLYVAFGSFSDWPPYHGWLFAYDPKTLQQLGVFNSSPTYRNDYDHGSAAAFWNGGASPSFEDDGSFYIVAADGSTDVENGGIDYGDAVLHMSFTNGQFKVLDWFVPFNRDCIDFADLEMGSGGFALLPADVGGGRNLGVVLTKEGRLYLLDRANLGHFNATTDQVVQQFMVGDETCDASSTEADAEGTDWNRLYGNASYWNGNLYMAASNAPVNQYSINSGAINSQPVAVSPSATGVRGGNTVVSSNGTSNGIVWEYEKTSNGLAILHALNATNISNELWNSQMNASRDGLVTGGEGFQVPVVIDGKVIVTSGDNVVVYSLLP